MLAKHYGSLWCTLLYNIAVLHSYVDCLEVIPERVGLTYANPKYVTDVHLSVRRYGRKAPYVVNIDGINLHTWNNNVTVQIVFYEYLHNEYRPSFIEFNWKICDMINENVLVGPILRQRVECPVLSGRHELHNLTLISIPAVENFEFKWPFEKGKAVVVVRTLPLKEKIAEGYGILTFKQSKKFLQT